MFSTVHAATGAALGSMIPHAPLAFGLGAVSHFLLDRIPHNDPDFPRGKPRQELLKHPTARRFFVVAIIDLTLTFATISWMVSGSPHSPQLLVSGAMGGVLPDFFYAASFFSTSRWARWFNRFHEHMHFDEKKYRVSMPVGFLIQFAVFSASALMIFGKIRW